MNGHQRGQTCFRQVTAYCLTSAEAWMVLNSKVEKLKITALLLDLTLSYRIRRTVYRNELETARMLLLLPSEDYHSEDLKEKKLCICS